MKIRVLFFAGLRDLAGIRELEYTLDENSTVGDLHDQVTKDYPGLAVQAKNFRIAVNEEYSPLTASLHDGDTVALIPPVSGG